MKQLSPRPATKITAALMLGCMMGYALAGDDDDKGDRFAARLSGYNEVHFSGGNVQAGQPATPATLRGAVSSKARGSFKSAIDEGNRMIRYELTYRGLERSVTQAHIHFGQHHTVGGVVVWLCQTGAVPAPTADLTPACPTDGTVTGTIGPAQVLAATGQGIDAGQFDELVRATRAGATYVNVHSSLFPPGEIRGQLRDHDHRY